MNLFLQTLKSTQAMGEAMKGVTKAMGQMNRQMNLPSLQRIMQEFERQNEKMEMVTEVMGDALDDALEGDEEEEETEELVNQVLDEIGIDIKNEVCPFPHFSSSISSFLFLHSHDQQNLSIKARKTYPVCNNTVPSRGEKMKDTITILMFSLICSWLMHPQLLCLHQLQRTRLHKPNQLGIMKTAG